MQSKQRKIRRVAMQTLYQIDLRGQDDLEAIRAGLGDLPKPTQADEQAYELATAAWEQRKDADEIVAVLAPQWPTHRQPPLDRAILRLAHYEMASGRTPVKVAINEAIELAKRYCCEQSPSFINGVLDKIAKRIDSTTEDITPENLEESSDTAAVDMD